MSIFRDQAIGDLFQKVKPRAHKALPLVEDDADEDADDEDIFGVSSSSASPAKHNVFQVDSCWHHTWDSLSGTRMESVVSVVPK